MSPKATGVAGAANLVGNKNTGMIKPKTTTTPKTTPGLGVPSPVPFSPPPTNTYWDPNANGGAGGYVPLPPIPPLPGPPGSTDPNATGPAADLPTLNAKAELTRLLGQFGLAGLADVAWDIYRTQDITDPNELMLQLETTADFRRMFPGLRDPDTGEMLMSPAQWTQYSDQIQSMAAEIGHAKLSRAEIGALIQNRRSVQEVAQDMKEVKQLNDDPYARAEFFAYTGQHVSGADLLGLRLGQRSDLEQLYQTSIANGVSADQFNARMSAYPQAAQTGPEQAAALAPAGPAFTALENPADAAGLEHQFQQSIAASRARWTAGGQEEVATKLASAQEAAF